MQTKLETSRLLSSQFLQSRNLYESYEESCLRESVLGSLDRVVKEWVKIVHQAEGYSSSIVEEVNAKYVFKEITLHAMSS